MLERQSLVFTLWLACLLLLASTVLVPARAMGPAAASSSPDRLRLNFTPPPHQPPHCLTSAMEGESNPQAVAFSPENEEQDGSEARPEPRVSSLIPCAIQKISNLASIAPRSSLSLYPLRC